MVVEIVGQQLRIRVVSPKVFDKFRTHDVGAAGRLQRVVGYASSIDEWRTQSWRLNLEDYSNYTDAYASLLILKGKIKPRQFTEARRMLAAWYKNKT